MLSDQEISDAKVMMIVCFSSPEHCGRDEQRRHAGDRGPGGHAQLRRHRDSEVRSNMPRTTSYIELMSLDEGLLIQ